MMKISEKLKGFLSKKIEFKLPSFGRKTTTDSYIFYFPTSDRTLKIEKNHVSTFHGNIINERVISFLTPGIVRNEEIALSKFVPEDDLASNIEIKAFDELGLDAEMDYKIVYEQNRSLSSKRTDQQSIFNVYFVSSIESDAYLASLLQRTGHIDSLAFAPLAFKRFFSDGNLIENKTYALVYMYKNQTFLCIYDDGELMYVKGLKITIDSCYEKYCDTFGDKPSFGDFVKIFCKNVESQSESFVDECRVELFKAFSDVLTHAKRLLNFEKYDTIFISSEYGDLVGIDEFAKQYFETPVKHLNFKQNLFGDQVDALSAAIILDAIDDATLEFSTHERLQPILQRKSGRLLALGAVSLLLFSLAPFLKYSLLSENITNLQKEYDRIGSRQKEAESLIGQKNEEVKKLESLIASEKNISAQKSAILAQLANTKESNSTISPILVKIANIAFSSSVRFDVIELDENGVYMTIKSPTATAFTQFVKNLSRQGLKAKAGDLQKDTNSTQYIGAVEVAR